MFTDAEFMSAKEKELVLKQWKSFLKALSTCDFGAQQGADYGYFPAQLDKPFTDRLYKHLSLHCGFIAHYNRLGFLSSRFSHAEVIQETIEQMQRVYVMSDYRDLHQAMMAELRNNLVIGILARAS